MAISKRAAATVGLLDGNLADSTYRSFRGKLLSGIIRQAVPAAGPLDAAGDPAAVAPKITKLEGFPEGYSVFTRTQAGIPGTDLQLNIFAASMPGVKPEKDNQVRLDRKVAGRVQSQWYQIRGPVAIDPANVLWNCQSFEIEAPADAG
jgi:hypothetical protein